MIKIDREALRGMLYEKNMTLGKPELYAIGRSLGMRLARGMTWDEMFNALYDRSEYPKLVQAIIVEARSAMRYCPEASKHKLANLILTLTSKE